MYISSYERDACRRCSPGTLVRRLFAVLGFPSARLVDEGLDGIGSDFGPHLRLLGELQRVEQIPHEEGGEVRPLLVAEALQVAVAELVEHAPDLALPFVALREELAKQLALGALVLNAGRNDECGRVERVHLCLELGVGRANRAMASFILVLANFSTASAALAALPFWAGVRGLTTCFSTAVTSEWNVASRVPARGVTSLRPCRRFSGFWYA